ncbi:hypothetical protein [Methanomethylovorans sp.]
MKLKYSFHYRTNPVNNISYCFSTFIIYKNTHIF